MPVEQRLLQLLATGLTTGAIYSLLGLGLVLVFTTARVINVAIGEFAALGALLAVSLTATGLPLAPAALLAVAAVTLLGALLFRTAVQPAQSRGAGPLTLLIVTIALHLVLKGAALIGWGTQPHTLPPFSSGPPLRLLGAVVQRQAVWVLAVTVVAMALLGLFFSRTVAGKALRACAVNPVGARLSGIPVEAMRLQAFALAAGLAALSGVLVTPITMATYDMGFMLGLKGFVGAVIGGLQDYPRTVAGCMLLAVLEALAAGTVFASGYRDAIAFVVLLVVLLVRALPALRLGVLVSEEAARE